MGAVPVEQQLFRFSSFENIMIDNFPVVYYTRVFFSRTNTVIYINNKYGVGRSIVLLDRLNVVSHLLETLFYFSSSCTEFRKSTERWLVMNSWCMYKKKSCCCFCAVAVDFFFRNFPKRNSHYICELPSQLFAVPNNTERYGSEYL